MPNVGDYGKQVNSHISSGIVKWYNHLENSLADPSKFKFIPTLKPSNSTPLYLPKIYENMYQIKTCTHMPI